MKLLPELYEPRLHDNLLRNLLSQEPRRIRIVSPYVTQSELLTLAPKSDRRLITSLSQQDIICGATSLSALRKLIEAGVQCRSWNGGGKLHAKVYLIEDDCIVTSANMTHSAVESNVECGVHIHQQWDSEASRWFEML